MTNYEILGVSPNDNEEVIKQAYRRLSKKYHPDIIGGDGKKFMQIKEAYEELMNPSKRYSNIIVRDNMYDRSKGTLDLHIISTGDFIYAQGIFGNKECTWSMLNRSHHILHISQYYIQSKFEIKYVTKDYTVITRLYEFDIPKKRNPDVKLKVETKSSDSSCLGCIGQVVILWIIIEVIKYFFNVK